MLIRITIRSNIIAGAIFKILSRSFYAEILALQGFPAGLRDSYFIRDKSGYPEFRNNQTNHEKNKKHEAQQGILAELGLLQKNIGKIFSLVL